MGFASKSLRQTEYFFSKKRIKALSISLILLILSVIFIQINIINAKENNNPLTNLINYQQTTNVPELQWYKTYGGSDNEDRAYSIQQTNDGGYIVAGYTRSFYHGGYDVLILKLDNNGNLQWNKTYGGSNEDRAYSIQQTNDEGYIVAGYTNSFGNGGYDVYILKLNSNGNLLWNKTYGGSGDDVATSIQQTNDGGYILAGWTYSLGNGYSDIYILKLDSNGNLLWNKAYRGRYGDAAYSIQQTNDGGYILAGYIDSFGNGYPDVLILKLDSNGNSQWQKTYGGNLGVNSGSQANSIQQTNDGGYIVAGYTGSYGFTHPDVYILKLDSNGHLQWYKTYGGDAWDEATSIQQTNDGGYIVAGYTGSYGNGEYDVYVLKLDSNGNLLWNKTYGGSNDDRAYSIQQTNDGGYIVAGYSSSFGSTDVYILKLAPETSTTTITQTTTTTTTSPTTTQTTTPQTTTITQTTTSTTTATHETSALTQTTTQFNLFPIIIILVVVIVVASLVTVWFIRRRKS